jgi:hypothetical protein
MNKFYLIRSPEGDDEQLVRKLDGYENWEVLGEPTREPRLGEEWDGSKWKENKQKKDKLEKDLPTLASLAKQIDALKAEIELLKEKVK